jgi:hypothetical protein
MDLNRARLQAVATTLSPEDRERIRQAAEHLEHPSLAARLTSVVGTPIEVAVQLLPRAWYKRMHGLAEQAIGRAYGSAIESLRPEQAWLSHDGFYKTMAVGTGAMGGALGLFGLPFELPIITTLMLRSIADIARNTGEDLRDPDTRMACLEVFALGGRTEADDAAETGYYGLRLALAIPVTTAMYRLRQHGVAAQGGTALLNIIASVAPRFGITLSQKTAAQLVPAVGAAGGALVNLLFMQHFQDMAHHHFTLRALERKYGRDAVQAVYEECATGN